ncbi:MAG: sulfite oxidase [Labilithrix sp.]|nr:sulfite oxidase [Labilithrix sp.]MCW5815126.1 sulfite oxidase [Labilithrix sp.]
MIGRRGLLRGAGVALAFASPLRADETREAGEAVLHQLGADPQNLSTPQHLFTQLTIPTRSFFVRSHFGPPALDRDRALAIEGLVTSKLSLKVADLEALPKVTVTAVLQCSGNGRSFHAPRVPGLQWDHGAMGQATFTGVRLKDLLEKAGLDAALKKGAHVHLRGADAAPKPSVPAFVRSIPIERALDPGTLVAYAMNGEPLTLEHGAPMRLVVPGWAGDHWVKWLTRIAVEKTEAPGFFMQTAYKMPIEPVEPGAAVPPEKMRTATTFPVKSIIGAAKDHAIAGVAFSGEAPIAKVEVSLDGGKTWKPATLEGEAGAGRWQVFRFTVPATMTGTLTAHARATDAKGNVQPEKAQWNPSGYFWNAWHSATWSAA